MLDLFGVRPLGRTCDESRERRGDVAFKFGKRLIFVHNFLARFFLGFPVVVDPRSRCIADCWAPTTGGWNVACITLMVVRLVVR